MEDIFLLPKANKNVNIKFDIFSCFYRFAVLHNTQPVLLYIFTFRQRNSKAATAASLSRSLFPFLCKLLYLFLCPVVKICAFRYLPAYHLICYLICATLPTAVRVAVIYLCPLFSLVDNRTL